MPSRSARSLLYIGVLGAVMAVPSVQAQSLVRSGSFEIGPFVGASYGLDETRVMGGGNVTFAITKRILPYFEYSYFPEIGRNTVCGNLQDGSPINCHFSIPISDFHGGVHIRFPIKEKPVVPYAVFGVGGLHHSEHTVNATYTVFGQQVSQPLTVPSGTDKAINFGGGIRYYISQSFGVRVEAKAYKPYGGQTGFTDIFGKAEFGFFFQLR
ncbi:MAG TPA: hypothetical protein VKU19_25915 [Bryobacteraceae bacterium]|nr:hypothetical protein [Bryobacteraceae bacterium]